MSLQRKRKIGNRSRKSSVVSIINANGALANPATKSFHVVGEGPPFYKKIQESQQGRLKPRIAVFSRIRFNWLVETLGNRYPAVMNFLCHAIPYLDDDPLLAVCTGVPDWLSVVDRKIRARRILAEQFVDASDQELRSVARGVIRHIEDDRWFHGTQAFVETNLTLAVELRDLLPGDTGFRPMFVGHVLIEMLLDAFWIRDNRTTAENYYATLRSLPFDTIQNCVNTITGKPTKKLVDVLERYVDAQFLFDYLEPEKLLLRLNQVMKRVKLTALPEELVDWIPDAEKLVESRRQRMLTPPDGTNPFEF